MRAPETTIENQKFKILWKNTIYEATSKASQKALIGALVA